MAAELRDLGEQWREQELLDPSLAGQTAEQITARFAELQGELIALRDRPDELVRELAARVAAAR